MPRALTGKKNRFVLEYHDFVLAPTQWKGSVDKFDPFVNIAYSAKSSYNRSKSNSWSAVFKADHEFDTNLKPT